MSFASRLGYENRDPKLKVVEPPVVRAPVKSQGADLAIVARMQAELKAAHARIAELEAELASRPITPVMAGHNATITPRNAAAERQRAYRERQKVKKADARQS